MTSQFKLLQSETRAAAIRRHWFESNARPYTLYNVGREILDLKKIKEKMSFYLAGFS
jgi:protein involved in temperature-dependent protein secretion